MNDARIHAKWVTEEMPSMDDYYVCSNCKEAFVFEGGEPQDNGYNYCPNCGAKMDKE